MSYEQSWYYKTVQKLNQKIKHIHGSQCHLCKSKKNLQLHHMYYTSDSVRPKSHNESGTKTRMRKQKAIDRPERFLLVCLSCHNKIEPRLPRLKVQREKRVKD